MEGRHRANRCHAGEIGVLSLEIQESDLRNWTSTGTNQVFQGSLDFVDMDAVSNPVRFYHAIPQLNPPTQ